MVVAGAALEPGQALRQRGGAIGGQLLEHLERVAQPLRPDPEMMEIGLWAGFVDAATGALHGTNQRARELGRTRPAWAAAARAGRGGDERREPCVQPDGARRVELLRERRMRRAATVAHVADDRRHGRSERRIELPPPRRDRLRHDVEVTDSAGLASEPRELVLQALRAA